ncbi:MAG: TonB-dependent receptor [Pedobacter sp.]|nr:MAG: TonB-dependent receptor [Pedobacter sp.]
MNFIKIKYISCLILIFCFSIAQTMAQRPNETVTVSGKVVDQKNNPIAGVTIFVQERKSSNSTGADGSFSFETSSNDLIIFQKEGFLTLSKSPVELTKATIALTPALIDAGDGDDVQIPFGVRKKRAVSATISTVNVNELPQLPLSTLNNALTGRLSGLYIQQTGTRPGTDDASFLIRGRSSYNNGQSPLILVDGVERDFVDMDLAEIESISVLKDAASLAWYGMSGSNGVLYVRTKRGSATATRVTFDAQGGLQTPVDITRPLDSYSFATLYNEAQANSGIAPSYSPSVLDAYRNNSDPLLYPNNNLVDQFLKDASPVQRYVGTVSGGNAFAKYFTMFSFFDQAGLYQGGSNPSYNANTNFRRINFRTNLDIHVNKTLDVTLDVAGRSASIRYPRDGNGGFLSTIFGTPSNAFPIMNADGTYGGSSLFRSNPRAMLESRGNITDLTRTLFANVSAKQKLDFITEGLSLNAFYSYDVNSLYASGFTQNYEVYEFNSSNNSYTRFGNKAILDYAASDFNGNVRRNEFWGGLDYDRVFGDHSINASSRVMRGVMAMPGSLLERREQIANRVSYGFKQRYFLDAIGTYAASETFMPGRRAGFFPAVSAGWIASEEGFLKNVSFLDYLKVRASYGLVGNDAISTSRRFIFNTYYNRGGNGYLFGTGYAAASNTTEAELANPNLTWETTRKTDVGVDVKLFKQSLSLSADYFHENRTDLLTNALIPTIIGQSGGQVNGGEAEYKGFEAALNYTKRFGEFEMNLYGNFTHVKSNIIQLNQEAGLPSYQLETGFPISGVVNGSAFNRRFLEAIGLFGSQAEIDAAPVQRFSGTVKPGDIRYRDINGDGVIDNFDFVQKDFTNVPTSYYGFGTSLKYKGFDLAVLFQGTQGRTIQIASLVNSGSTNTGFINQFSVDRWTPETAETAKYPRLALADRGNNTQVSDFWLRSGDFLRLKHAELGYSLNNNFVKRMKVQSIRFYVSGFNLLTFDKLGDLPIDPEIPEAGYINSYPYLRSYSLGLNVKF